MENNQVLDQLHQLHLILADEVKRICEKHQIRYFLLAGSLLGAVRHHGFIPWDDDMDFGMCREDFEKFLKVCEEELDPEQFYLQTDRKDRYYTFNFAKLCLTGTRVVEGFSSDKGVSQGVYIDIFPLDRVADRPVRRFFQYKIFWVARNLLWIKCGYGEERRKRTLKYRVGRICAAPFSIRFLKKLKYRSITCCAGEKTASVVTSDGTYGLTKETLNADWVEQLVMYDFEGHSYPGIRDYDAYLTYLYGDYRAVPPEDQRDHHERLEVDFGRYFREGY
jgi:lipopolysaccharide cholinephosphotransferase